MMSVSPNIPPNCVHIRYLCLGQATTRGGWALGVSEIGLYIYIRILERLSSLDTQQNTMHF